MADTSPAGSSTSKRRRLDWEAIERPPLQPADQEEGGLLSWFQRIAPDPAKRFNPRGYGMLLGEAVDESAMAAMVAALRWPHYVYALCSETGAAFYVGKGVGDRAFHHRREAQAGGDSEKCKVIRALGPRLRYCLFAACQDDDWATMLESVLINADYPSLTNIRPGSASSVLGAIYQDQEQRDLALNVERLKAAINKMIDRQAEAERALVAKFPALAGWMANLQTEHQLNPIS